MCERQHHKKYKNCTNSPKHVIESTVMVPCQYAGTPDCGGWKDNYSFDTTNVTGGICSKC